ncbi:hypothetical protein HY489_01820, partial [Candidatus Woesearchaeota archaeon]|nr:hypothetical protein [Candidatus Woesearchaeota archaeon]
MTTNKERTEQEKKDWLNGHFYHEVNMLISLLHRQNIMPLILSPIDHTSKMDVLLGVDGGIILEAQLLHIRVLIEFLFVDPIEKFPNDAKPTQFVKEGVVWRDICGQRKEFHLKSGRSIEEFYETLHIFLAHLTYDRSTKQAQSTEDCREIYNILFERIKLFLDNVDDKYVDSNIKQLKEYLEKNSLKSRLANQP